MSDTDRQIRVPYPARYETLDGWRGVASGMVLAHHFSSLDSPVLGRLWLGVQIFFVISGYCLGAALDRAVAEGATWRQFMARRVRRIGPPYLGSVLLAILLEVHVRGLAALAKPWNVYVQNATMTQWLSVLAGFVRGERRTLVPWANGALLVAPHWSLNYEEQFYLVIATAGGLAFLAGAHRWLVGVTLLAAFVNWCLPGAITGLFTDYWLQFACGLVVYYRLARTRLVLEARLIDLGLVVAFLIVTAEAWVRGELHFAHERFQYFGQLAVCLAFALALVALRPLDARVARSLVARPVMALGWVSYSLYLVHYPVIDYTEADRLAIANPALRAVLGGALLLGFTIAYYFVLERPFLSKSRKTAVA